MPLASAIGLGNEKLINLHEFPLKIYSGNCAIIGVRCFDCPGKDNIKKINPTVVYAMADIDKLGIHRIIWKIIKQFKEKVYFIHVNFAQDSVNPSVAPSVGTSVSGELSYRGNHSMMESISDCGCISSLEMAEVNPILNDRNNNAVFATDVIGSKMRQRIL
jgi:arginase